MLNVYGARALVQRVVRTGSTVIWDCIDVAPHQLLVVGSFIWSRVRCFLMRLYQVAAIDHKVFFGFRFLL